MEKHFNLLKNTVTPIYSRQNFGFCTWFCKLCKTVLFLQKSNTVMKSVVVCHNFAFLQQILSCPNSCKTNNFFCMNQICKFSIIFTFRRKKEYFVPFNNTDYKNTQYRIGFYEYRGNESALCSLLLPWWCRWRGCSCSLDLRPRAHEPVSSSSSRISSCFSWKLCVDFGKLWVTMNS